MSIIHVGHIRDYLENTYRDMIDLSDASNDHFLTRALSAYALQNIAQIEPLVAASTVTDGSNDNGIDSIYYDERSKYMYIGQTKWMNDGKGEPENGDVKKFISGIRDLFDLSFDRFNDKISAMSAVLDKAIKDPKTRYQLVLSYTGINHLSEPSVRDLDDFLQEMNDASDVVELNVLNQTRLHRFLAEGVSGQPIDLEIHLKSWGIKNEPLKAYYGQINGSDIASWWENYRNRILAKNIRGILGNTDVNEQIKKTIEEEPEKFWYFNNGITLICRTIEKTMFGGSDRDSGQFICHDVSIVNGAQTFGALGRIGDTVLKSHLETVFVPIKIISLNDGEEGLGDRITKANNTQNRIESRDFVSLDPEQGRIRTELAIEGINYHILRSEEVEKNENSFDIIESTTALACASKNLGLTLQLKREIGKLWEDISKAPYKQLFNPSVSGMYLWRCVQIQRRIDDSIKRIISALPARSGRNYGVAVHGNRMIAYFVFMALDPDELKKPDYDIYSITNDYLDEKVIHFYDKLVETIGLNYDNSTLATLFKNAAKCKHIWELIVE